MKFRVAFDFDNIIPSSTKQALAFDFLDLNDFLEKDAAKMQNYMTWGLTFHGPFVGRDTLAMLDHPILPWCVRVFFDTNP